MPATEKPTKICGELTFQFSSFNGFNLSSDKRLKDNIEDVEDDAINIVKYIKIKTFVKNQKTRKAELGWISQDVQQNTNLNIIL